MKVSLSNPFQRVRTGTKSEVTLQENVQKTAIISPFWKQIRSGSFNKAI